MIFTFKSMLILIISGISIFLLTKIGRKNLLRLSTPVFALIFILFMVIYPDSSLKASVKGLTLWFNIVFPSLFPFFVASYIINQTGLSKAIGIILEPLMRPLFKVPGCGSIALLMGITSGYPVGAKITCDLRKNNYISKSEGERLLAFTNNSGPLFIIGSIATGMLNMPELGVLLLSCHITASLTIGFLFRFYNKKEVRRIDTNKDILKRFFKELKGIASCSTNPGKLLGDAIMESLKSVLSIGGFIILFSVIISILLRTGVIESFSNSAYYFIGNIMHKDVIMSLICGIIEISTGSGIMCQITDISIIEKLIALSFIIGWAGFSVHLQVYSIISSTDISLKPYLFGKFLHGIFSSIYTFIAIKYLSIQIESRPAFKEFIDIHYNSTQVWSNSLKYITIDLLILLLFIMASIILCHIRMYKKVKEYN